MLNEARRLEQLSHSALLGHDEEAEPFLDLPLLGLHSCGRASEFGNECVEMPVAAQVL